MLMVKKIGVVFATKFGRLIDKIGFSVARV